MVTTQICCPACDKKLGTRKLWTRGFWFCNRRCAYGWSAPEYIAIGIHNFIVEKPEGEVMDPVEDYKDAESFLLGLLNRVLSDCNHSQIELALRRIYPGAHNAGWTQCLVCFDTGVICTLCGCNPHEPKCKDLKSLRNITFCGQDNCEASAAPNVARKIEHRELRAEISRKEEEIQRLRAQFAAFEKVRNERT
jgi:hypothetical protein